MVGYRGREVYDRLLTPEGVPLDHFAQQLLPVHLPAPSGSNQTTIQPWSLASLTARAIQLGSIWRADRRATHSWVGSCVLKTLSAEAPCSGPSHDRAQMALPAGRVPSANNHRLACCNCTVRFPKCNFREGPEVKNTSRTGTCVVKPNALASAAPLATITSPLVDSMAWTTAFRQGLGSIQDGFCELTHGTVCLSEV